MPYEKGLNEKRMDALGNKAVVNANILQISFISLIVIMVIIIIIMIIII